ECGEGGVAHELHAGELVRVSAAVGEVGGRVAVTCEAAEVAAVDELHATRLGTRVTERDGVEVDVVRAAGRAHERRDRLALLLRGGAKVRSGHTVQAAREVLVDGAVRE